MADANAKSFYELSASLPGGKTYKFDELKGKVVLIVNVASKWYGPPSLQVFLSYSSSLLPFLPLLHDSTFLAC